MEYYYDIYLNFNDEPINYYEWSNNDKIERLIRVPIIKINSIKDVILYKTKIDTDQKFIIFSDGINAVAVELINKSVAYLSYLAFRDEFRICDIAKYMELTDVNIEFYEKRQLNHELRLTNKIKNILIKSLDEDNKDFIKYIYYIVTNKENNDYKKIKEYLIDDINNNFSKKYLKIYDMMCN